jgi:hypothetical protein
VSQVGESKVVRPTECQYVDEAGLDQSRKLVPQQPTSGLAAVERTSLPSFAQPSVVVYGGETGGHVSVDNPQGHSKLDLRPR